MARKTVTEWEDEMLALPVASSISGEHEEHLTPDQEGGRCLCTRCLIIRIKRRRAFRFPMTKCPSCGELFTSLLHQTCERCRPVPP